ncbi:hypothetical protein BD560DRAFT_397477 [Blakeslea trispora]|nr:hypothetical protein BD560DRAFT_397477 [Blakeslea trispora]
MIPLFPLEIIDRISSFLTQEDYYQLVLVNRSYFDAFILRLHRHIEFDDEYELGEFLQVSRYHQYIQSLKLQIQHTCKFNKPTFETAFPIWASMGFEKRHIYHSVELSPFRDLKFLTLVDCGDYPTPLDIVAFTPHLTSLTIETLDDLNISAKLLDGIFLLCPRLEYLDIAAYVADRLEEDDIESAQRFDSLKTLSLRLTSGLTHHELFNRSYYGFHPYQRWLKYIANRFSNIESLIFQAHSMLKNEAYPPEFYEWFHSQCPHLVHFEWCNVVPDDLFLEKLNKEQQQSQMFRLTQSFLIEEYLVAAPSSRYPYLSLISNLEIEVPDDSSCYTMLRALSKACPKLQELNLYQCSTYDKEPLYIDSLLDLLPFLKKLYLRAIAIHVNQAQAKCQQHPLEKIHFRNCYLTHDVFDYVAPRCLDLKYLVLENLVCQDKDYEIKIHLPHQKLVQVDIQYIRIDPTDFDTIIQLFHVQQKNRDDWHFISKHNEETGQTISYKRLSETDMKNFNSTASQLRTLWLEPDYQAGVYADTPKSALDGWDLCKVIEKGYMSIVCESVHSVVINSRPYDDFFLYFWL